VRRTTPKRLVAAAAVVSMIVALPAAAFAQNSTSSTPTPSPATTGNAAPVRLAYCHGRADAEVQRRMVTLGNDLSLVNGATHLTSSDKATLANLITSDQTGLSQLKTTIDGTTDVAACHTDGMTIVTSFRVYVLVDPKIHLTVAADRAESAGAIFNDLSTKLQTAVNNAKAKGKDVDNAQASLDAMNAKVSAAMNAAGPVPGQVLPLAPGGYPGSVPTLQAARQALETVRQDLRSARAGATTVVADLG
jgi:hypothetical protein